MTIQEAARETALETLSPLQRAFLDAIEAAQDYNHTDAGPKTRAEFFAGGFTPEDSPRTLVLKGRRECGHTNLTSLLPLLLPQWNVLTINCATDNIIGTKEHDYYFYRPHDIVVFDAWSNPGKDDKEVWERLIRKTEATTVVLLG